MKKVLLILTSILVFSACSKDDDSAETLDPILDQFNIVTVSENNVVLQADSCLNDSFMSFGLDNGGAYNLYGETVSEDCGVTYFGGLSWSKNNQGLYLIQSEIPFLSGTDIPNDFGIGELSGDFLSLVFDNGSDRYEILMEK